MEKKLKEPVMLVYIFSFGVLIESFMFMYRFLLLVHYNLILNNFQFLFLGVDLVPIKSIKNVTTFTADITSETCRQVNNKLYMF